MDHELTGRAPTRKLASQGEEGGGRCKGEGIYVPRLLVARLKLVDLEYTAMLLRPTRTDMVSQGACSEGWPQLNGPTRLAARPKPPKPCSLV